jgi:hypothetical protein
LALGKWRQEDWEFGASLSYIARTFFKNTTKNTKRNVILIFYSDQASNEAIV